jgi:hypothetical protein
MTVIDEKEVLDGKYRLLLFQAPEDESTSRQRLAWVEQGTPFFDERIYAFWELYCKPFSKTDTVYLNAESGKNERRRFIKHLISVTIDNETNEVTGGVWLDNSFIPGKPHLPNRELFPVMHIKAGRSHRSVAYPLLLDTESRLESSVTGVTCTWGPREPEDDPTQFFQRNNYRVAQDKKGGIAIKKF